MDGADKSRASIADAIRARRGAIRDRGVTSLFVYGSRARGLKLASIKRLIEEATGLAVHITTASSIPEHAREAIGRDAIRIL